MARKNPEKKKVKIEKPIILKKEIGSNEFETFSPIKVIGNCRYIENYLGIRINTPDRKSLFYSITVADIDACFMEPLSVAFVYSQPDRMKDDKTQSGSCRMSKTQRSLNIVLDSGEHFFISKKDVQHCFKDILFVGKILQFTN